jgi:NitT/TauT family transport system substrate-binding protein
VWNLQQEEPPVSHRSRRLGRQPHVTALAAGALVLVACAPTQPAPTSATAPGGGPGAGPAASPAAQAAPPRRVSLKTHYTTTSAGASPLWLALEGGAFAEQGLDAEVSFVTAGQASLGALTSGETPLGQLGATEAIDANLRGGEFVILASAVPYINSGIFVLPEIQRPEDLRGKTVGVSNFGSASHAALKIALAHFGMEEGRDVTVVRSGGLPESLAAMAAGAIQGGSFGPPQSFQARDMGFRELIDVTTLQYEMASNSSVTTRAFAAQQPDTIERFLKALIKGVYIFKTNKELTIATIMRYARIDDPAIAEATRAYYLNNLKNDVYLTPRAVENSLQVMAANEPEALGAKPEQFLDTSFIERIKASGYVEQVWGSDSPRP